MIMLEEDEILDQQEFNSAFRKINWWQ
jgi:hypothetical protein